uniref:Uncharacterized protein n=1 Tax=Sciurus vulgaris TaxID=55149 RepID=A0A8D2DAD8_SCIVU
MKSLQSMVRHRVRNVDSSLVKMNSSLVKSRDRFFLSFPSAKSKETVIIHCHSLYKISACVI